MKEFKAVEFMRERKKMLEEKYKGDDLETVVEKIHKEVESSPVWKDFLRKQRVGA